MLHNVVCGKKQHHRDASDMQVCMNVLTSWLSMANASTIVLVELDSSPSVLLMQVTCAYYALRELGIGLLLRSCVHSRRLCKKLSNWMHMLYLMHMLNT